MLLLERRWVIYYEFDIYFYTYFCMLSFFLVFFLPLSFGSKGRNISDLALVTLSSVGWP